MSLENNIRQWVQLDNKLKQLNQEHRNIKQEHNKLSSLIIDTLSSRHDNTRIVKISDGRLNISNVNHYQPITFNYLKQVLNKYFNNSTDADKLLDFIKKNREMESSTVIKRTYDK